MHTWSFRSSARGTLHLDFHSTFGNSHAKGLCVVQADPIRGWLFALGQPETLRVWIGLSTHGARHTWRAEIGLRGRPHVGIEATR